MEDFELICVDDGSTDDTPDILRAYSATDQRIRILTIAKSGQGAARNAGLAAARGRYLSFLDADDVFDPNLLKDSVNTLERDRSDIVVFAANQLNDAGGSLEYLPWSIVKNNLPGHSPFSPLEMKDRLFNSFQNWPWNKVFRHGLIEEHHILYPNIDRHEDVAFVSSALSLAEKISVLDKAYVNYRRGTGKSLWDTVIRTPAAWLDAYIELGNRLKKENVYELYERSHLNKTLNTMISVLNACEKDEAAYAYLLALIKYEGERKFGFLKHEREFYFETASYDAYVRIMEGRTAGPLQQYKEEILEKKRTIESLDAQIRKQAEDIISMRNSVSFRLGRVLTFVPRKLCGGIRCYMEHGMRYTIKRALEHLGGKAR